MLNLSLDTGISPFDSRVPGGRGRACETIRTEVPIAMAPGDALLSSVSVEPRSLADWLRFRLWRTDLGLSPCPGGTTCTNFTCR